MTRQSRVRDPENLPPGSRDLESPKRPHPQAGEDEAFASGLGSMRRSWLILTGTAWGA